MTKNLATIQSIKSVEKHPNADSLYILTVLGWQCVTNKSDYKVGDFVVYIQVDTTVPKAEWSEFLFDPEKPEQERARIKSIKLRKKISQGLCLPLEVLGAEYVSTIGKFRTEEEANEKHWELPDYTVLTAGMDVTELLDIGKYEKPVSMNSEAIGGFPTELVSKTDEERIQNFPELIEVMQGKVVVITKKMDGTSATYVKQDDLLRVCSRNQELKDGANPYWNAARKFDLEAKMVDGDFIQGELIGSGIQGNKSGEKEKTLKVFNVGQIQGRKQFGYQALQQYCAKHELESVDQIFLGEFNFTLESLLELADAQKYDNGAQCEGIVIRLVDEEFSDILQGRTSFKVISNKFAVKHGE